MKILDTIKQQKVLEVQQRMAAYPLNVLEQSPGFERECISLKKALTDVNSSGIIAEFKRKSPSKGNINIDADIEKVISGYIEAGVSGLSVLTDEHFFGARDNDFRSAKHISKIPMLRKDFIIDEYQIFEYKAMGADVILLIAKMLTPKTICDFTNVAHQLGMEVLLETHTEKEIVQNIDTTADLVGINNRNLNTFEVDIENSIRMAEMLPADCVKIAESGIESAAVIKQLKRSGFSGFLIGEYFMKNTDPGGKCNSLIKELSL
ncbi:indole-3-glycerol phosphate synthase [Flavobacterium psychrophilum]|nr:indole-3-glycerol phosphate synthase [Flavobacterium psychrophilum]AOE51581.1 indole-3-glycerol phosphate synthase [Flavobacterium psychrophilum]